MARLHILFAASSILSILASLRPLMSHRTCRKESERRKLSAGEETGRAFEEEEKRSRKMRNSNCEKYLTFLGSIISLSTVKKPASRAFLMSPTKREPRNVRFKVFKKSLREIRIVVRALTFVDTERFKFLDRFKLHNQVGR